MPDTGAPWNIPYVDPTDLVRDYPQASEDLADAIADGLDAAAAAGGLNLVQAVKTDVFTTTSTSYTSVTGLAVTITPSSDTSKVLLLLQTVISSIGTGGSGNGAHVRITGGNAATYVGDADGNRVRAIASTMSRDDFRADLLALSSSGIYLDSPGTASPVTYQVEMVVSGETGFVNQSGQDDNAARQGRQASSITAIEVAV